MEGFSLQKEKLGFKSKALGLSLEVGASCLLFPGGERLGVGRAVSGEAGPQEDWVVLWVPGREGEGGSGFPGCSEGWALLSGRKGLCQGPGAEPRPSGFWEIFCLESLKPVLREAVCNCLSPV